MSLKVVYQPIGAGKLRFWQSIQTSFVMLRQLGMLYRGLHPVSPCVVSPCVASPYTETLPDVSSSVRVW